MFLFKNFVTFLNGLRIRYINNKLIINNLNTIKAMEKNEIFEKQLAKMKVKLPYLLEINDIDDAVKLGFLRAYTTKNVKQFQFLDVNRGAKDSIEPIRIKNFADLIALGKFVNEDCHVKVNRKGKVIDGHHHIQLAIKYDLWIIFMVVNDPRFNDVTDREFANNVAKYNNINPSWGDKPNFNSALAAGEECAKEIFDCMTLANTIKVGKRNPVTPSRMVDILNNFAKGLINRKEDRSTYCNEEFAKIMKTPEFKAKFLHIMSIINQLNKAADSNVREFNVIKLIAIKLKATTDCPNWGNIDKAVAKYISKNKKLIATLGDKSSHFILIADGAIEILNKMK